MTDKKQNIGLYYTTIVTKLLDRIEYLEKELEIQKDISADRFFDICNLEDKLYMIQCPICKRSMTIIENKETSISEKGQPYIKNVILSCSHPYKK